MASFNANTSHAMNMNTIGELSVLTAGATSWTSDTSGFTATNAALQTEVDGRGFNFALHSTTSEPTGGDISSLTIFHGGSLAYAMSGLDYPSFLTLQADIAASGPQAGLAYLLSGNDTINGTAFADVLHGFAGNDLIRGYGGADKIFGDDGNDTLIRRRRQGQAVWRGRQRSSDRRAGQGRARRRHRCGHRRLQRKGYAGPP